MADMKKQETAEKKQQEQQSPAKEMPVEKNAEEKIQELTELLQRTQANLENYRKQTEKRMEEVEQLAGKNMLLQLLPLADEFELALKTYNAGVHEGTHISPEFVKGIELIYAHLIGFLEAQGVQLMTVEGEQFDPYQHEALLKVPSDVPENTILKEFQKGYLLHGQVLRHARVKVSAGRKEASQDKQKEPSHKDSDKNQHKNTTEE